MSRTMQEQNKSTVLRNKLCSSKYVRTTASKVEDDYMKNIKLLPK